MKAVVYTLGCKTNSADSASIMAALSDAGYEVSDELEHADLFILNTCAVTREAERKSRQLYSRVRKYNPDAKIYVCGCASQRNAKPFVNKGAEFVCGVLDKEKLVAKILGSCDKLPNPKQLHTRAFVKIQEGCNNFCTYCIIPYLRGRETSRPVEDIVAEISSLSNPEIVLTGPNISSYNDNGRGLADLIAALAPIENRIRLGSIECTVIDDRLLKNLKNLKDFAPQFHLSLQSGSTAVLKSMNRHYTREDFLAKCSLIREYFPEAALTSDIIIGYPTETEKDFRESLSIVKEARLVRTHCFPFSPREGTAAYKLPDLPPEVKQDRHERLFAVASAGTRRYIRSLKGVETDFIAEEHWAEYTTGYSPIYVRIYVDGSLELGKKYKVRIGQLFLGGVFAKII